MTMQIGDGTLVQMLFLLLPVCSAFTIGIVEVIKKLTCEEERQTNLIAVITGFVVGLAVTSLYYLANDIAFTALNIGYMIVIGITSVLGATLGYDKIFAEIKKLINKG